MIIIINKVSEKCTFHNSNGSASIALLGKLTEDYAILIMKDRKFKLFENVNKLGSNVVAVMDRITMELKCL
jgi:hypothetical protein